MYTMKLVKQSILEIFEEAMKAKIIVYNRYFKKPLCWIATLSEELNAF